MTIQEAAMTITVAAAEAAVADHPSAKALVAVAEAEAHAKVAAASTNSANPASEKQASSAVGEAIDWLLDTAASDTNFSFQHSLRVCRLWAR